MSDPIGRSNIAAARAQRDILHSRGRPVPERVERIANLKMDLFTAATSRTYRHGQINAPVSEGVEDLIIRGQVPPMGAVQRGHIWGITASFGIREEAMESITITPHMVQVETNNGYTHIFEVAEDE